MIPVFLLLILSFEGGTKAGLISPTFAISPISLSVDVSTDIVRVGEELIVHVSATNAYSTMLETDENSKQYGDAVYTYHVVFHRNKIRRAWIKVTAYGTGIPRSVSQTIYIRLRFYMGSFPQEAQQTYNNSLDHARGYNISNDRFYDLKKGWDVMWEFMKFGARYNQSIHDALYSGEGLAPEQAIEALYIWAKEYFNYFYEPGSTIYTAYETLLELEGFNGETDTFETFVPGKRFECASMAAFISGTGLVMGLPSRMVSLSDTTDQNYQHMFAEIYGYSVNNNNGWFLIDPAHPNFYNDNATVSSYSSISQVRTLYSGNDGTVQRLRIIWGINSTGWGEGVQQKKQQTSWISSGGSSSWAEAPHYIRYIDNPWGIYAHE